MSELRDELEELVDHLRGIELYGEAYPAEIFREPDWKAAHALFEGSGMTLDGCCGSAMRRVGSSVSGMASSAILKLLQIIKAMDEPQS